MGTMKAILITTSNKEQLETRYGQIDLDWDEIVGLWLISDFGHNDDGSEIAEFVTDVLFEMYFEKTGKELNNGFIEVRFKQHLWY